MSLKGLKLGVALCGSYCTYQVVFEQLEKLVALGVDIYPIMSTNAYTTDTRFGTANEFILRLESLTGKKIIHTIVEAEPLGPKNLIDAIMIAPCTGNTMAKLAYGVTDTPVLMAAKGLMRNQKPVIIALATNDGLGLSFKNIGLLLNSKNIYFVPLGQDDYINKPNSMVSHMAFIPETIEQAIQNKQLHPVFKAYQ